MPNTSNVASLATLGQRFQDPYYRCNQPQMLTFYPNLNRNPGAYHHMSGLAASRNFDDYSGGNCHYRLPSMREGSSAPKLPPRPKNIVKITNPETGDNIFNELEKERKLNTLSESKNDNTTKTNGNENAQGSPVAQSSTNLTVQQSSIPNSTSDECTSPKPFLNHECMPPGPCESNSIMTNSSASSRPPSVSLVSSSQEMTSTPSSSAHLVQQGVQTTVGGLKSHLFNFGSGRSGPADIPFVERPTFHDQDKSMYCNHIPMMIPTFGCRTPYVPPHLQQMPSPRFSSFYNLPHNFYDQPNYYYEGESVHPFFTHNGGHGFHQMHSRFPALSHFNAPLHQNSHSGSCSNSSEELNSEFDLQILSNSRLLDKSFQGRDNKYPKNLTELKDECKSKLNEDQPNMHNNSVDVNDDLSDPSRKPASTDESGRTSKVESQGSITKDIKEIPLDPNAKSFIYIGVLADSTRQTTETREIAHPGATLDGSDTDASLHLIQAGLEMKRFSSRGSNMDYVDSDTLGRSKKNSMSTMSGSSDVEESRSSSKMFRSGSEGGNLEKNCVTLPNGSPISIERRNTDTSIGKSGRIQYSREFLLNLQYEPDSIKTPKGLTIFPEIILNGKGPEAHRRQFHVGELHHSINPFIHPGMANNPSFSHVPSMSLPSVVHPNLVMPHRFPYQNPMMMMPPPSSLQQAHHQQPNANPGRQVKGKSFAQQQIQPQSSRKVIQVCLGQNVQLHQSENAWKPMTLLAGKKEEVDADEVAIIELYRKVRSILNKLTPQKFDTLIQQVHDLSIDTEEKLKGCIKLIFEKAIGEPSFSLAYAQMAKSLNNLKVHVDERPGETVTFRKLLLNQCQKEFEKDKLEELDLEKMSKQIEQATSEKEKQHLLELKQEAEKNAKRRSLGNIRFIGELFKLKMLTEHIMFDCINRLLRYSGDEDNVECLCRLLVTIGKDLDNASPASKQRLNQSFQHMKQLSSTHQLSSRIRFMIQDVLELRENDWVPRREDTKPKLIEQIHKEAEMEELHKRQHMNLQHKNHHQNSSSSIPHELQRSSSLASSGIDHRGSIDRGSLEGRGQFSSHQGQHHYQGRGSIDRNLRQPMDRFSSLERVKTSDNFSGGGNGSSKLSVYATLGHSRKYPTRPLTGGGNSISSSDLGRTLETLRNESTNIQLAPSSYKQQHKPWQEGSSGGGMRHLPDSGTSPLPPTALRSRGSASDIYGRSFARSPVRFTPRSRIFDPKALERDKHAAIAAAKSISASMSADSFMNPPASTSHLGKSSQLYTNRPSHNSIQTSSLSPRDPTSQHKELEKKCQSLLGEYLATDDLQEACLVFKELHSMIKGDSCQMLVLTNYLVNNSLEKTGRDRQKIAVLLSHLVLKNLVSVDTYLDSISSVLKDARDISIDIPKVWDYLAELVSRAILGKVFSFGNLPMLCLAISDKDKRSEFIGHIIKGTTLGFSTELNIADQPHFMTDLILFLGNITSHSKGSGKDRLLNEELIQTHSGQLRKCLGSEDLEWQVLLQLKSEIHGLLDIERAPAVLMSMVSMLQRNEIISKATVSRWNNSTNGCK